MAELLLVNPRRRRRAAPKRRTTRRRTTRAAAAPAPRRRRRTSRVRAAAGSVRRRVRRTRSRINRRGGFVRGTMMPAAVGGMGALGVDILLGFLPLPAAIQTGAMRPVVRIAAAIGLGMIASKVANRKLGEQVTAGALTVVLYDTIKGGVRSVMPELPGLSGYPSLSYVNAALPMGEYVANAPVVGNLGEYMGVAY